jgi:hypothetical protein
MLTVRELIEQLRMIPESEQDREFATFDQFKGIRTTFPRADLRLSRGRIELHGQQDENQR